MTTSTEKPAERRIPLTRERVLRTAIELADTSGIDSVSMRKLGNELGVEAMSLYNHVANKEEILDGMIELVVSEISLEADGSGWKDIMLNRILRARATMLEHPWVPTVIETRTKISPVIMRYFDDLLGLFIKGGFSYDLAHHAMHVLGSRALGFNQELFEPDADTDPDDDVNVMLSRMADQFPYIVGMVSAVTHDGPDSTLGWCDDETEFRFGLDLILDGLERLNTG